MVLSQDKHVAFEVQPFIELVYRQSGVSSGKCVVCVATPLKIIRGRINPPTGDTASIIETHSRVSGDLTYDRLFSDDPRTYKFVQILRAIPCSSIFHLLHGLMLY
jgi:hypothetical protein